MKFDFRNGKIFKKKSFAVRSCAIRFPFRFNRKHFLSARIRLQKSFDSSSNRSCFRVFYNFFSLRLKSLPQSEVNRTIGLRRIVSKKVSKRIHSEAVNKCKESEKQEIKLSEKFRARKWTKMNKSCARCSKVVYPIEELKCLDKVNICRRRISRWISQFSVETTTKHPMAKQLSGSFARIFWKELFSLPFVASTLATLTVIQKVV